MDLMGASWAALGPPKWTPKSLPRTILDIVALFCPSFALFSTLWESLRASWEPLRSLLDASWASLGPSWEALGSILEPSWITFSASKALKKHLGSDFLKS